MSKQHVAIVAACGLGLTAGLAAAQDAPLPDYYPADYQSLVEASRSEGGELLIYSNMAQYNWAPVIEGFNELYPWIEVQTLDLGSGEVFERYYAESGSGTATGDMLVSGAIDKWLEFDQRGAALEYESPELAHLPDWSQQLPGIFTVSADPMVIAYNKRTVPEEQWPASFADIVANAEANPDLYDGKITTYHAADSSFGFSIAWAFAREHGDQAWDWWDTIGPMTRPEASSGPMIEKVTAGEYSVGYFISGIVLFPKMDDAYSRIVGWSFFDDGTPLFQRGMAIPQDSARPASAKLMVDYILSNAGQTAFGKGGLTPYREDVDEAAVLGFTYQSVVEAIGGEENVILIDYDTDMLEGGDDFRERWRATLDN